MPFRARVSPQVAGRLEFQHCIPDGRRSCALETQSAEIELILLHPTQELNSGDRDRGVSKSFEIEHWTEPQFDASVILLDHVVQVFGGEQLRVIRERSIGFHFTHSAVRRSATVQRDRPWRASLRLDGLAEECLCSSDVPPRTQQIDMLPTQGRDVGEQRIWHSLAAATHRIECAAEIDSVPQTDSGCDERQPAGSVLLSIDVAIAQATKTMEANSAGQRISGLTLVEFGRYLPPELRLFQSVERVYGAFDAADFVQSQRNAILPRVAAKAL